MLGHRPLAAIRPTDLRAWVRGRSEVLAAATVEVVDCYVVAILGSAVADRLITTSPAVGIKLPRLERRQVEPLATEVVERLFDAVPDRYRRWCCSPPAPDYARANASVSPWTGSTFCADR